MIRKDIYFYKEQIEFLSSLTGNLSENVRRAVDLLKEKLEKTSTSSSKSKGGVSNG